MGAVISTWKAIKTLFERQGLPRGRWIGLPKSRRFVVDYLHFAKQVPSQCLVRHCNIAEVARLRRRAQVRIGWSAVFMKAYALLARRHAALSRTFMTWPWMHLYEHPRQVGRIAMLRRLDGEDWLTFARIIEPDRMRISEIQRQISEAKSNPLGTTPLFRLRVSFCGLPSFLRRTVWWLVLNVSGSLRTKMVGTFGVSSVSCLGAISIHPPSLGDPVISYGPVDSAGNVRLTFVYDHRIFDGMAIARFLEELEDVLNTSLVEELRQLQPAAKLISGASAMTLSAHET